MSVLLPVCELREQETLLPFRPGDFRIFSLKTSEAVISFMSLPWSSLFLVVSPWGGGGNVVWS